MFEESLDEHPGETEDAPAGTTVAENGGPDGGEGGAGVGSSPDERRLARAGNGRRGSGRQKHDAKITVYMSGEELLAMEHARLTLRGTHGLVVDRGRIVREAVAVLLADFDQHGEDSVLVGRLRDVDLGTEEAAN
ncbi:hypothetical protein SacmaDRAFT_3459 [Saccharomonospora marina XMU15]|uniref:Cobyrinic acid a,c-diamide synthase n=2 Tax=Saccharomonospora TaxID=1851 RepID=H5WWR6_9PSEU|nr:hypothetical protein SacmaDRAFT_3459 [Saccharomonospora marina XMU15]